MATQKSQQYQRKLTQSKRKGNMDTMDRVVHGLRIPPNLNSVQAVTFVLTQEAGKLKPKDLKVAIDRNRAERETRSLETMKIKDQGGGSGLDLQGILAEDMENISSSDPFRRQLREMAFLADVDEVYIYTYMFIFPYIYFYIYIRI
jgi:hypothetical protein